MRRNEFAFVVNPLGLSRIGCEIVDVTYSTFSTDEIGIQMTRTSDKKYHLTCSLEISTEEATSIVFHVKLVVNLKNYSSQLEDVKWTAQLWEESVEKRSMTDVDFVFPKEKEEMPVAQEEKMKIEESLFAHRFIFSARSPVFAAMFSTDMIESKTGRVEIHDASAHLFKHFLKFIYTGQLDISARNFELLALADKYEIETLRELCLVATQQVDIPEIIVSSLLS